MSAAQVDFIERGGRTLRMHTVPTLQPQNVAAHSFGVAWWCWLLSEQAPSTNLLMAALQHDLAEHATGDIPAPTKHWLHIQESSARMEVDCLRGVDMPNYQGLLTANEARILKLADCFELAQHCVREVTMGNKCKQLISMFSNVVSYTREAAPNALEKGYLTGIQSDFLEAVK